MNSLFSGKTVFVNWPMMHEAVIVGVSDCKAEYSLREPKAARAGPGSKSLRGATGRTKAKLEAEAAGGADEAEEAGGGGGGGAGGGGGKELAVRKFSSEEATAWAFAASDLRDEYKKVRPKLRQASN